MKLQDPSWTSWIFLSPWDCIVGFKERGLGHVKSVCSQSMLNWECHLEESKIQQVVHLACWRFIFPTTSNFGLVFKGAPVQFSNRMRNSSPLDTVFQFTLWLFFFLPSSFQSPWLAFHTSIKTTRRLIGGDVTESLNTSAAKIKIRNTIRETWCLARKSYYWMYFLLLFSFLSLYFFSANEMPPNRW